MVWAALLLGVALDCGPDGSLCATAKYGLGDFPAFRDDRVPADPHAYDHVDFGPPVGGTSYHYVRGGPLGGDADCGAEREFFPYTGQILLRERIDCVPTGSGPDLLGRRERRAGVSPPSARRCDGRLGESRSGKRSAPEASAWTRAAGAAWRSRSATAAE